MSYENPQVPHEVNVSRESAITEFVQLALALLLVLGVGSAVLYFAGGWLARSIPFAVERSWVGDRVLGIESAIGSEAAIDAKGRDIEGYLSELTTRVRERMHLPQDMVVQVHYVENDVPNAFATLGGHVVVTQGLYRRVPSENALCMVLAHEVAHIKARDPIAAIGSSATLSLVWAWVGGESDSLASSAMMVVALGYSREAERAADEEAIAALRQLYGHAGGAASVFEALKQDTSAAETRLPSFLSTHPADDERIAYLKAAAAGWDPALHPTQPLAVAAP